MNEAPHCEIRQAAPDEAAAVSAVILDALRFSNAKDYPPEVIERVSTSFSPDALSELMMKRMVLVACFGDRIVATASLDGSALQTMFVAPDLQRRGLGKRLLFAIEDIARGAGVSVLALASSITAEPFYAALGYRAVRDVFHGDERTILMERAL